jgi:hypothetical protein
VIEASLESGGAANLRIDYAGFLRDYDQVEQKGLGAGVHEAFVTDRFTVRAMNMRNQAAMRAGPSTKTIDMLTPEIKKIYLLLRERIQADDNEDFFIE